MKIKIIVFAVIIFGLVLGVGIFGKPHVPTQTSKQGGHHDIWYCPMHPHYTSDRPGKCPICGMDLVKEEVPQELPSVKEQASSLPDYVPISVSPQKQQLAGVRTEIVTKENVIKTIRAVGQYEGEVFAQVFESDLEFIKVGQKAIVEVPAYHQEYGGVVNSIDSSVDETSRTIRVRISLQGLDQRKFKSNMFLKIKFLVERKDVLAIPREAVMDTGIRKIVFVQKEEGLFEPREIKTGWETDDGFEVKSGLKEGEHIVISGNFLLDSESRIQAGLEQGDNNG